MANRTVPALLQQTAVHSVPRGPLADYTPRAGQVYLSPTHTLNSKRGTYNFIYPTPRTQMLTCTGNIILSAPRGASKIFYKAKTTPGQALNAFPTAPTRGIYTGVEEHR